MINHPTTVVLIQEPYWYKDKIPGTPKNVRILGTQNSRAVIAAPSHLPLFLSHELTSMDHTVAFLTLGSLKQMFASIYLDIMQDCRTAGLQSIGNFLLRNPINAILGIDSNAYSPQ